MLDEERCEAPLQSLLCDGASHRFCSRNCDVVAVGKSRDRLSEKPDLYLCLRSRKTHALSYNAGVKPPHGGVATACSVAQSTLLTPRCGVGLNDLLGGGGCPQTRRANEPAENRSRAVRARPVNFPPAVSEATGPACGN